LEEHAGATQEAAEARSRVDDLERAIGTVRDALAGRERELAQAHAAAWEASERVAGLDRAVAEARAAAGAAAGRVAGREAAAGLRERIAVLEIELAERAADLEAVEHDRAAGAARAAELHERFVELDRRREDAERHAAEVLGAVADARDLVRRRLVQLDGVDARLAVLATRLDEDQLVAEARAL